MMMVVRMMVAYTPETAGRCGWLAGCRIVVDAKMEELAGPSQPPRLRFENWWPLLKLHCLDSHVLGR